MARDAQCTPGSNLERRSRHAPPLPELQVLTEADVRLFVTLVRFDAVYVVHFKCCAATIAGGRFPRLHAWLRDVYQLSPAAAAYVEAGELPSLPVLMITRGRLFPRCLLLPLLAVPSTSATFVTTTSARTERSTRTASCPWPFLTTGLRRMAVTLLPSHSPPRSSANGRSLY